ncbi:hypothetical protein BSL78_06717 [Apostichopus japonicus]|uniref:Uncharacterized protein n=1 Tax=Stichopus japonicus TaxID=307972 RepID=A0A2G8L7V5_STIJA|nr:hypothetical protein BSL78_06717 [Apostichopus japonicus]
MLSKVVKFLYNFKDYVLFLLGHGQGLVRHDGLVLDPRTGRSGVLDRRIKVNDAGLVRTNEETDLGMSFFREFTEYL